MFQSVINITLINGITIKNSAARYANEMAFSLRNAGLKK